MVLTEEQRKEYMKKYYEANKEKIKERRKEHDIKYREKNKEKIKESNKKYSKTEEGKKSIRIKNWKIKGVICEDFNKLYDYYLNCWNCEECGIELVKGIYGANKKCLDHNHKTGQFRNVLCNTCNIKRYPIDNNKIKLTSAEYKWKYNLKKFILS